MLIRTHVFCAASHGALWAMIAWRPRVADMATPTTNGVDLPAASTSVSGSGPASSSMVVTVCSRTWCVIRDPRKCSDRTPIIVALPPDADGGGGLNVSESFVSRIPALPKMADCLKVM